MDVGVGDDSGGSQIAFTGDGKQCLLMTPPAAEGGSDYRLQGLDLAARRLEAMSGVELFGFFGVRIEPGGESALVNVDQGQHGSTLYRYDLTDRTPTLAGGVLFDDLSSDGTWLTGADDAAVAVSEWPSGTLLASVRSSELTGAAEGGLTHGYLEAMAIGAKHVLVWARPASPVAVVLARSSLKPVGVIQFPGGDHRPVAYRGDQLLAATDQAISVFRLVSLPD